MLRIEVQMCAVLFVMMEFFSNDIQEQVFTPNSIKPKCESLILYHQYICCAVLNFGENVTDSHIHMPVG